MRQNADELLTGIAVSTRTIMDCALDKGIIQHREDAVSLLLSSAFSVAIECVNKDQNASALEAVTTTTLVIERNYAARIEAGEIKADLSLAFTEARMAIIKASIKAGELSALSLLDFVTRLKA